MRKFFLLSTVLVTFPFMVAAAQSASSDSSSSVAPSFLRLYFAELIMHEARLGLEIGTAPRQSLVIDGSYMGLSPSKGDKTTFRFVEKYTGPATSFNLLWGILLKL
ncbi:hypothetical protein [Fibrisoma limi]|uniref:hypothetical protein n=1 Tax=Fibrisoma limi TaxID=663275 RepID=UPI0005868C82|nr:hypothetical protein [Fibrisoma limi]